MENEYLFTCIRCFNDNGSSYINSKLQASSYTLGFFLCLLKFTSSIPINLVLLMFEKKYWTMENKIFGIGEQSHRYLFYILGHCSYEALLEHCCVEHVKSSSRMHSTCPNDGCEVSSASYQGMLQHCLNCKEGSETSEVSENATQPILRLENC